MEKNLKIKELEDKKTKKFLEFFKQNLEKRKLVKVTWQFSISTDLKTKKSMCNCVYKNVGEKRVDINVGERTVGF